MCLGDDASGTCSGHQASEATASVRGRGPLVIQIDGLLFEGGPQLCGKGGHDQFRQIKDFGAGREMQFTGRHTDKGECFNFAVVENEAPKTRARMNGSPEYEYEFICIDAIAQNSLSSYVSNWNWADLLHDGCFQNNIINNWNGFELAISANRTPP